MNGSRADELQIQTAGEEKTPRDSALDVTADGLARTLDKIGSVSRAAVEERVAAGAATEDDLRKHDEALAALRTLVSAAPRDKQERWQEVIANIPSEYQSQHAKMTEAGAPPGAGIAVATFNAGAKIMEESYYGITPQTCAPGSEFEKMCERAHALVAHGYVDESRLAEIKVAVSVLTEDSVVQHLDTISRAAGVPEHVPAPNSLGSYYAPQDRTLLISEKQGLEIYHGNADGPSRVFGHELGHHLVVNSLTESLGAAARRLDEANPYAGLRYGDFVDTSLLDKGSEGKLHSALIPPERTAASSADSGTEHSADAEGSAGFGTGGDKAGGLDRTADSSVEPGVITAGPEDKGPRLLPDMPLDASSGGVSSSAETTSSSGSSTSSATWSAPVAPQGILLQNLTDNPRRGKWLDAANEMYADCVEIASENALNGKEAALKVADEIIADRLEAQIEHVGRSIVTAPAGADSSYLGAIHHTTYAVENFAAAIKDGRLDEVRTPQQLDALISESVVKGLVKEYIAVRSAELVPAVAENGKLRQGLPDDVSLSDFALAAGNIHHSPGKPLYILNESHLGQMPEGAAVQELSVRAGEFDTKTLFVSDKPPEGHAFGETEVSRDLIMPDNLLMDIREKHQEYAGKLEMQKEKDAPPLESAGAEMSM